MDTKSIKSKLRRYLVCIVKYKRIVMAIFFIVTVIFSLLISNKLIYKKSIKSTSNEFISQTPISGSTLLSIATPTPRQKEKIFIVKQKFKEDEKILYQKSIRQDQNILRWNNWLIYQSNVDNLNAVRVLAHNISNNSTKELFVDDYKESRELYSLEIINNNLFLTLGAYMTPGAVYWIDLPINDDTTPQLLINMRNPSIVQSYGRYWIIGGEGDSCWGEQDIALFDPVLKTATIVAESIIGCKEGDEYIGLDSQDRLVYAFHPAMDGFGTAAFEEQPSYAYIYSTKIETPNSIEGIVAKQNMPKHIHQVELNQIRTKILLIGKELYEFDLRSKKLVHLLDLSNSWTVAKIQRWDDEGLCLFLTQENGNKEAMSYSYSDQNIACSLEEPKNNNDYEKEYQHNIEEIILQLNLPEGYEAGIEDK
ncbi:MAG: hypothetical protein Q8P72_04820 [Candidatus Roizmanbacteria bacterium]|nr:hypothetical protein [Candidatus Roizmanbacteria bacterium]